MNRDINKDIKSAISDRNRDIIRDMNIDIRDIDNCVTRLTSFAHSQY